MDTEQVMFTTIYMQNVLYVDFTTILNKNKQSIGSEATKCRVQSYIFLK
jgi:hypothetical protein